MPVGAMVGALVGAMVCADASSPNRKVCAASSAPAAFKICVRDPHAGQNCADEGIGWPQLAQNAAEVGMGRKTPRLWRNAAESVAKGDFAQLLHNFTQLAWLLCKRQRRLRLGHPL
jgi:hypothetical protein